MPEHPSNAVTVRQVMQMLDELAPPALAAEWDTAIGLEIGNPDQLVNRVLITLDVCESTVANAIAAGCELIITHHPLIFSPIPIVREDIPEQRLVLEMIRSRISLLAAHTNLDAAPGGVADCLADTLGLPVFNRQDAGPFGRLGSLEEAKPLSALLEMTRRNLHSPGCRINTDRDRIVSRLAVFPGSFDENEIPFLLNHDVEAIICGELKHHIGLMLAARGIAAIDAGHDVTERIALRPLASKIGRAHV